jgi:hypothetical protein
VHSPLSRLELILAIAMLAVETLNLLANLATFLHVRG